MSATAYLLVFIVTGCIITSLCVLLAKRLMLIISAVGIGSIFLAVIFFLLGAPFAGAFELSVGAGLMSVLFVLATSLAKKLKDKTET